jgi:hypothetical protein
MGNISSVVERGMSGTCHSDTYCETITKHFAGYQCLAFEIESVYVLPTRVYTLSLKLRLVVRNDDDCSLSGLQIGGCYCMQEGVNGFIYDVLSLPCVEVSKSRPHAYVVKICSQNRIRVSRG